MASLKRRLGGGLTGLLKTLTCLLGLLIAVSYLAPLHWSADWLTLFYEAYLLGAVVLTLGWLALRRWRWAALSTVLGIITFMPFISYWLPVSQVRAAPSLRLYSHNIYYLNSDLTGLVAEIERHSPDLVFLMEYSSAIQREIEEAFAAYPYRLIEPSRWTMGVALFSRFPLEAPRVHRSDTTRIPIVDVSVRTPEGLLNFVGAHPWPPLPRWAGLHRRQMADVSRVAAEARSEALLVAGDFNASPWSYTVRTLERSANVSDAGLGFGFGNTWRLAPFFALPIDQVLVSEGLEVVSLERGNPAGSDHVPLVVDLRLP